MQRRGKGDGGRPGDSVVPEGEPPDVPHLGDHARGLGEEVVGQVQLLQGLQVQVVGEEEGVDEGESVPVKSQSPDGNPPPEAERGKARQGRVQQGQVVHGYVRGQLLHQRLQLPPRRILTENAKNKLPALHPLFLTHVQRLI